MRVLEESESTTLTLGDTEVPLRLRRSARARRITLRLAPAEGTLVLTLPPGVKPEEALGFARRQEQWVRARLSHLPPRIPFRSGSQVPFLGDLHEIRHVPRARGGVWREEGTFYVSGQAEHLSRRLHDHLRREARSHMTAHARELAEALPEGARPLRRVSVRDTVSRWGSCSSTGNLSFSWRLIFAPRSVLEYVVAHEVAHLVHMDHSPAFWRLNGVLSPHVREARTWLRREGPRLLRYG